MPLPLGEVERRGALHDAARLPHGTAVEAHELRVLGVQVELEGLAARPGLRRRRERLERTLCTSSNTAEHLDTPERARRHRVPDADHLVGSPLPQKAVPSVSTVSGAPTMARLAEKLADTPR